LPSRSSRSRRAILPTTHRYVFEGQKADGGRRLGRRHGHRYREVRSVRTRSGSASTRPHADRVAMLLDAMTRTLFTFSNAPTDPRLKRDSAVPVNRVNSDAQRPFTGMPSRELLPHIGDPTS